MPSFELLPLTLYAVTVALTVILGVVLGATVTLIAGACFSAVFAEVSIGSFGMVALNVALPATTPSNKTSILPSEYRSAPLSINARDAWAYIP